MISQAKNKLLPKYDYIIAGAGMSGLMLAIELINSPLKSKKVLLIDKEIKNNNDRTWCYWGNNSPEFDSIVFKEWKKIRFATPRSDNNYTLDGFTYKYIRGIDFYAHANSIIAKQENFTQYIGAIDSFSNEGSVIVDGQKIEAEIIFNSIHPSFAQFKYPKNECYYLLQHFKGYFIKTDQDIFNPESATFMDFTIPQFNEARFGYILPFNKREALVEYTFFSKSLLKKEEYESLLHDYITNHLGVNHYEILHEEFGIVPMSTYAYAPKIDGKIIKIGTLGGFVKPSSGFAFSRTHKRIKAIVSDLATYQKVHPSTLETRFKYKLYDNILLSILENDNPTTRTIFEKMFLKMRTSTIFRFLDEESTLPQEIRVMSLFAFDFRFTKAIVREITNIIRGKYL